MGYANCRFLHDSDFFWRNIRHAFQYQLGNQPIPQRPTRTIFSPLHDGIFGIKRHCPRFGYADNCGFWLQRALVDFGRFEHRGVVGFLVFGKAKYLKATPSVFEHLGGYKYSLVLKTPLSRP